MIIFIESKICMLYWRNYVISGCAIGGFTVCVVNARKNVNLIFLVGSRKRVTDSSENGHGLAHETTLSSWRSCIVIKKRRGRWETVNDISTSEDEQLSPSRASSSSKQGFHIRKNEFSSSLEKLIFAQCEVVGTFLSPPSSSLSSPNFTQIPLSSSQVPADSSQIYTVKK